MTRVSLPSRRQHEVIEFRHGHIDYRGSVSFDLVTGLPVEVFLCGGKVGSEVESGARDCAVIVSLEVQHGVPLETLRRALTRLDDGKAAGPMGRLLDLVAEAT